MATAWRKVASERPVQWDRSRFYPINGRRFPSVTTVLDVIHKPALGPWYAKMERQAFEIALLEVAAKAADGLIHAESLLDEVIRVTSGVKAGDKEKKKAATIGSGAHAWIEWETKRRMGIYAGAEPVIPDPSRIATDQWSVWAKEVGFRPVRVETQVHSNVHGYAGTADWIAYVRDVLTLGDYKTSKGIWPESYLQNIAYRQAALEMGAKNIKQGLIIRLPKTKDDPGFEVGPVPDVPFEAFLCALRLWRHMRILEGKDPGDLPAI